MNAADKAQREWMRPDNFDDYPVGGSDFVVGAYVMYTHAALNSPVVRMLEDVAEYYKKQCRPCNSHYGPDEEGFKNDNLHGCDCLQARVVLDQLAELRQAYGEAK